jgi:hypothetical protein
MTSEAPMTDAIPRGASQPFEPPVSRLPPQPGTIEFEDDDLDITALPARRHVPAVTRLLLVGILAAAAFGGGVLVQKQHDAGLTSASGVPDFTSLLGGGLPTGANGGGGRPAASSAPATGGGGGSSTGDGPVLVGTVESISGSDLTVKDFGGTSHVVHATAATTLTVVGADWSGSLVKGATVSINGTKAADGSVTATAVTQR